jgi:glucose/arabinose dehydrogenase
MRKTLLALLLILMLPLLAIGGMLATGTIDSSSLRMMLNVMVGFGGPQLTENQAQQRFELPQGFEFSVYARDLPGVRFMSLTPAGDLIVTRPHRGDVLLLRRDRDRDGNPDAIETLLSGLKRPLGLDLYQGALYVAETNRVLRVPFDSDKGLVTGEYEVLVEGLTDNGGHSYKIIQFGPDDKLYLSQGSTCNVCEEQDSRRATMMRFNSNGSGGDIIANGLRNSMGFDWAPWDGALYATDNGRDLMGDDYPPCELNHIEQGNFYGWPYFNGDNDPDPDMGPDPLASERQPIPPVHGFRAHNAPLGISFIDPSGWPPGYERSALVALHGSWNRSEPDGYKVVSLHWEAGGIQERDFLGGFNNDGAIVGRPVDIAQDPDGSVYISDDYSGTIFRVSVRMPDPAGMAQ